MTANTFLASRQAPTLNRANQKGPSDNQGELIWSQHSSGNNSRQKIPNVYQPKKKLLVLHQK